MEPPRVVLVTGASSGIGRAVAELLAQAGHRVFGTSRDPSRSAAPSGVTMLPLDVRSDDSARSCVGTIAGGEGRIDVLVNNAGYTLAGALEEATTEQVRSSFETNVFGTMRMTRAVLPFMRRQSSGHIVNLSSGLASARPPFVGFYAAGKCAVEGYSESLWHELRPLGIHVSVVSPGWVRSNIEAAAVQGSDRVGDYEPQRRRVLAVIHARLSSGADPMRTARSILALITARRPALYVSVGADARAVTALRRLLPGWAYRGLVRRAFGL